MQIIRPAAIRATPRQLAQDVHGQTRRWPSRLPLTIDYTRDVILTAVPPEHVRNATPEYASAYQFMTRNKYGQRKLLDDAGIPVPRTYGQPADVTETFDASARFVVRPLRHSRSRGYRITDRPTDFIGGQQYLSQLYPKRREYRVVFVKGTPVVWLRKKPHEGIDYEAPWGHTNSFFQTINDVAGCKLSRTDAVARLSEFAPVKGAHLCAADILWAGKQHEQPYVVLELNFCPGLDLDDNRAKIVHALIQQP